MKAPAGCGTSFRWVDVIDLDFRPDSYFEAPDPLEEILDRAGSKKKRAVLRRLLEDHSWVELSEMCSDDSTPPDIRDVLGTIDDLEEREFSFGDRLVGEVDIVQVAHNSFPGYVIVIRARQRRGRILYRVVDDAGYVFEDTLGGTRKPLSMRRLVQFMDRIGAADDAMPEEEWGLVIGTLQCNLTNSGCMPGPGTVLEVQRLGRFLEVQSTFYPKLREYYGERIRAWVTEQKARALAEVPRG